MRSPEEVARALVWKRALRTNDPDRPFWTNASKDEFFAFWDVKEEVADIASALQAAHERAACKANKTADPPQDCDAPYCGCNPAWQEALDMARESGWLTPQEAKAAERALAERDHAIVSGCERHRAELAGMYFAEYTTKYPPTCLLCLQQERDALKERAERAEARAEALERELADREAR